MSFPKREQPVNRSEQLRQKRQPSARTRTASSSSSAARPASSVSPVITRRSNQGSPVHETASTQPRRKVYYAVGENGVETRMPSLPIIHFSWQWVSGILAILLLMFVIVLINSVIFKVTSLKVEGLTRYSTEEFQSLLKGRKTSIFLLNTDEILNSLALTYPELVDTEVGISMPNQVVISARERQPIILWQTGDTAYWIDAEGVVMEQRGEMDNLLRIDSSAPPPLAVKKTEPVSVVDYALMVIERKTKPVKYGELADRIDPEVLQAVINMSPVIPEDAVLVYDPISGMGWRDPGGWEVYFGTDLANIQFKQVEYQTILGRLDEMGVTPTMISVEHVDSPYFRTE